MVRIINMEEMNFKRVDNIETGFISAIDGSNDYTAEVTSFSGRQSGSYRKIEAVKIGEIIYSRVSVSDDFEDRDGDVKEYYAEIHTDTHDVEQGFYNLRTIFAGTQEVEEWEVDTILF